MQNLNAIYAKSNFIAPNLSFKALLTVCSPDEIIKLFSCLLTEKKIVLVAHDDSYQEVLAPLIESLLYLFEPLDSQVFTNVSYALNEEMVIYMEKPGSIILGMPQSLWLKSGQQVWRQSFDTYIVVFDLVTKEVLTKTDDMVVGMPKVMHRLARRALAKLRNNFDDLTLCISAKQAFFNVILLVQAFINSGQFEDLSFRNRKNSNLNSSTHGGQSNVSSEDSEGLMVHVED